MRKPLPHQDDALRDWDSRRIVSVSGLGGGKTWTNVEFAITRSAAMPPDVPFMCVAPTWGMVERVYIPSFERAFDEIGIKATYNGNKHCWVWGSRNRKIWLASGEKPEKLKGSNLGGAAIDEPGIQKRAVYENVGSRLRDARIGNLVPQLLLTGTHEGLGWFHKLCESKDKHGKPVARVIQSTTLDNPHNRDGYVEDLEELYPDEARRRQYIYGVAAAMSGTIFTLLRQHHYMELDLVSGEPFVIQDFNVDHMVSVIAMDLGAGRVHFFGEVVSEGGVTTEQHARKVAEYLMSRGLARPWPAPYGMRQVLHSTTGSGQIEAVVDASARSRTVNSEHTSWDQMEMAGFRVTAPAGNPGVDNTISLTQYALSKRLISFDPRGCPRVCRAVKEHAYKHNSDPPEPQKKWTQFGELPLDHYTDCVRYAVNAKVHVRGRMEAR